MAQGDVTMFTSQDVDAGVRNASGQPVIDASRFGEGLDTSPPVTEPIPDRGFDDLWPTDEELPAPPATQSPLDEFWADLEPAQVATLEEKARHLEAHATRKYQQLSDREKELTAREAELAQRVQQPPPQYYAPPQPPYGPYGYQPQFAQAPPQPQVETEPPLPSWAKTDAEFEMMSPEAQEAYRGRLEDHYERWEIKQDMAERDRREQEKENAQIAERLIADYNKLPADKPPIALLLQVADGTFGLRAKDVVYRAYKEWKEPLNIEHLTQVTAPGRTTIAAQRLGVAQPPAQSQTTAARPTTPSPEPEGGGPIPQRGRIAVDAKGVPLPFEAAVERSLRSRGVGVDNDETFGA